MRTALAVGSYVGITDPDIGSNRTTQLDDPEPAKLQVTSESPYRRNASVPERLGHLVPAIKDLLALPLCSDRPPQDGCINDDVLVAVFFFLTQYGEGLPSPYSRRTRGCGVQLEWPRSGGEISVEFFSDGDVVVMLDIDGEIEVSESLESDTWRNALEALRNEPDHSPSN